MALFFVAGITGNVGGAAARLLLRDGHAVRTISRDPRKAVEWVQKGVDVRSGDFAEAGVMRNAMEGVEGAFLMLPPFFTPAPGYPESKAIIASYRNALQHSVPPRLVVLSSIGSEQSSGLGLITQTHLLEEALSDLPCPTAFIRAGSFLENFLFNFRAAASTGWFDTYLSPVDRPVPMIATEDIGSEVARLLVISWMGKKIIELGSPVSPNDLAGAMSQALGRPVQARPIPREQWRPALVAQGMPVRSTGPFEDMEDGFNSGWIHFGVAGTEPVAGNITPAHFFAHHK